MTLKQVKVGETVRVTKVNGEGALRQHFLDMGIIPQAEIKVVKLAPMGDPMEIRVQGYELTLRLADADRIEVVAATESAKEERKRPVIRMEHPGLGEEGKHYHSKKDENPLSDDTLLTFALVGNKNSGKTTLFNRLTGAAQHVGNFAGVTVDRIDGEIKGRYNTLLTDLPGINSMSPYTGEEIVSRNFVLFEKPKAIINILDTMNIERDMYLTMQLLEMNIPMVVALNMMDEITANSGAVYINRMEAMLGVPVVPISAEKNEGVDELVKHAIHIAHYQEKPLKQDFCDEKDYGGAVHRAIHSVIHLIDDHAKRADIPVRFAAGKLIEGDPYVLEQLELDENEKELLEHIIVQMEKERGLDRNAAMADMRYAYIKKVCDATVVKPKESKEYLRSAKMDRILTGKYTGIPCFIVIMAAVFLLTFNVIGGSLQDLLAYLIGLLEHATDGWLSDMGVNQTIHSLIIDGIFSGVGNVLSFLPIIVTLFFFLSILEDSGYIARVAFVMDKILRKIGLSGRSIVPLLIGFGCTVPAVMSARTLPSERDRKMTILLTPFMTCTAKIPIYSFFVAAFFPKQGGLVMTGLYFLSIVMGIIVALIFKGTLFKGEAVPFVMELPTYRLPRAKNVGQLLWEKAEDFLQKAFSVILIATIVIWFLKRFDFRLNTVSDSSASMLALVAGSLTPIFKPCGMGDWRIVTSLISGFMSKESVVSTMSVLFGSSLTSILNSASAASMLVFSLLYTPCVASISTIRKEMGLKWSLWVVFFQCTLAWVMAFITYHLFNLIG